jgi:hypothetical protein
MCCAKEFYSRHKKRTPKYCSRKCAFEHMRVSFSTSWNGGVYYNAVSKTNMVLIKGKDKDKNLVYIAEYRYVVMNHLKRELGKNEIVIHIDNDKNNNNINNLYLCDSRAEMFAIYRGERSFLYPDKNSIFLS